MSLLKIIDPTKIRFQVAFARCFMILVVISLWWLSQHVQTKASDPNIDGRMGSPYIFEGLVIAENAKTFDGVPDGLVGEQTHDGGGEQHLAHAALGVVGGEQVDRHVRGLVSQLLGAGAAEEAVPGARDPDRTGATLELGAVLGYGADPELGPGDLRPGAGPVAGDDALLLEDLGVGGARAHDARR